MKTLTTAVLFLTASAIVSVAHAQDSSAGIRGRALDAQTLAPLIGAYVEITGTGRSTYTNADGAFFLPATASGQVTITVSQIGYLDLTATVMMEPGQDLLFELDPQPIVLEGLRVHTDRLERRRRAAGVSTRAFDRDDLALSSAVSTFDFIERHTNVTTVPCPGITTYTCVYSRGGRVAPRVYIDERPGSLDELRAYPTTEIYALETYGRTHIRAYTISYMDRVARGTDRIGLFPLLIQ